VAQLQHAAFNRNNKQQQHRRAIAIACDSNSKQSGAVLVKTVFEAKPRPNTNSEFFTIDFFCQSSCTKAFLEVFPQCIFFILNCQLPASPI
jgi:hypothetical protein